MRSARRVAACSVPLASQRRAHCKLHGQQGSAGSSPARASGWGGSFCPVAQVVGQLRKPWHRPAVEVASKTGPRCHCPIILPGSRGRGRVVAGGAPCATGGKPPRQKVRVATTSEESRAGLPPPPLRPRRPRGADGTVSSESSAGQLEKRAGEGGPAPGGAPGRKRAGAKSPPTEKLFSRPGELASPPRFRPRQNLAATPAARGGRTSQRVLNRWIQHCWGEQGGGCGGTRAPPRSHVPRGARESSALGTPAAGMTQTFSVPWRHGAIPRCKFSRWSDGRGAPWRARPRAAGRASKRNDPQASTRSRTRHPKQPRPEGGPCHGQTEWPEKRRALTGSPCFRHLERRSATHRASSRAAEKLAALLPGSLHQALLRNALHKLRARWESLSRARTSVPFSDRRDNTGGGAL